jgi:hypothetical protein
MVAKVLKAARQSYLDAVYRCPPRREESRDFADRTAVLRAISFRREATPAATPLALSLIKSGSTSLKRSKHMIAEDGAG